MKNLIILLISLVLNFNHSSAQHLKKDGTPDRRYKENRIQPNNNTISTATPQSANSNPVNTNAIDTNKNTNNTNANTYVQCSGMTKKGTRCKRMTNSANGRCFQH